WFSWAQSVFSGKGAGGWDRLSESWRRLSSRLDLRAGVRPDAAAASTSPSLVGAKAAAPARPPSRPESPQPTNAADLRLSLPETLRLEAGRSVSVPIQVSRAGFLGPVTVHFEGLPAGVSLPDLTVPPGQS